METPPAYLTNCEVHPLVTLGFPLAVQSFDISCSEVYMIPQMTWKLLSIRGGME